MILVKLVIDVSLNNFLNVDFCCNDTIMETEWATVLKLSWLRKIGINHLKVNIEILLTSNSPR